jgi:broad specificity phosphatase PhoE
MKLIIVRHGETDWTLAGRYTGATDVLLTANGRREAASLPQLLDHLLDGHPPVVVSSPRQRATETAVLALPDCHPLIEPFVAEYDYGDYEGLTGEQILLRAPGWDIWPDGCPNGETTADVGTRADAFLRTTAENCTEPLIVVTHGHFSRILAARALGLAPEYGRLFASTPAAVSLIEDHHGERCLGLWNVDAALLTHLGNPMPRPKGNGRVAPQPVPAGGRLL